MPVSGIGSLDMAAMWQFLGAGGYQADIAALRQAYPTVGWASGQDAVADGMVEGEQGTLDLVGPSMATPPTR